MKYIIILGGAAAVIAAGFLFIIFGDSTTVISQDVTNVANKADVSEETTATNEPLAGQGTLQSLIGLGQSVECTIVYEEVGGPAVTGTYFVHDGRIRGDFLTEVPELGGNVLSSIIMRDSDMYMWSDIDGQQYGMKIDIDSTSEVSATESREPIPRDVPVAYDCRPWTSIDNSIFEPPATILFQDMSALLETGMEYGTVYTE